MVYQESRNMILKRIEMQEDFQDDGNKTALREKDTKHHTSKNIGR
jgi:hypothetical protein